MARSAYISDPDRRSLAADRTADHRRFFHAAKNYFEEKFVDMIRYSERFASGFRVSEFCWILSLAVGSAVRQSIHKGSENNGFLRHPERSEHIMAKKLAQNISLFSSSDFMSTPVARRDELAQGGVFASAYGLMQRMVPCPKGSVITIMTRSLSGEELVELAKFAKTRSLTILSKVSFDGLTSEIFTLRAAAVDALVSGRYELAARYGRLLQALEEVEEARRDLALVQYFEARVAMEEWQGNPTGLVALRGAVITAGKASGLTDDQIEDDITDVMNRRAAAKIAA